MKLKKLLLTTIVGALSLASTTTVFAASTAFPNTKANNSLNTKVNSCFTTKTYNPTQYNVDNLIRSKVSCLPSNYQALVQNLDKQALTNIKDILNTKTLNLQNIVDTKTPVAIETVEKSTTCADGTACKDTPTCADASTCKDTAACADTTTCKDASTCKDATRPQDIVDTEKAPEIKETTPKTDTDKPISQTPVVTDSASAYENKVLDLVNKERSAAGLSPLKMNEQLRAVAREKSRDMSEKKYFSHTSPTYGSPFDMLKQFNISYRTAAENIAQGYTSPEAVVDGWMNSPGHRANILNGALTQLGVGYHSTGHYWTQLFIG